TLSLATASYHLLEMPFRRGAFRRWRASWTLAPVGAATLAVGLVVVTRGVGPNLASSVLSSGAMSSSAAMPESGASGAAAPTRVLAVGDSVAFTMILGLQRLESQWNLSVWDQGMLGCGFVRADEQLVGGKWTPQRQSCRDWADRWRSYVDAFQPDVVVMLVGAWDTYDLKIDGRLLQFGTPEADAYVLSELGAAVDVLSSGGAKVILLTTPYFQQPDLAVDVGTDRFDSRWVDRLNALYAQIAQQRPDRVTVLDLNGLVSPGGKYTSSIDGVQIRNDGVHFTAAGGDFVARWLGPQLAAIAGEQPRAVSAPTAPSDAQPQAWPASHWLDLLRQVPDTSEARAVTIMNDYARFRVALGVPLPDPNGGESALFDYYRRLLFDAKGMASGTAPAQIMGITEFPPLLDETRAQLGFTIADIDQDASTGWGDGGNSYQVLRGRFDPLAIDQAVRADPASAGLLATLSHSGVDYYQWDAGSDAGSAGTAKSLGPGHQLASTGEYLYWSGAENGVASMIDAGLGVGASLADVEEFRLLAQEIDKFNTYTALFSDDVASYSVPELAKALAGPDASEEELAAIEANLGSQATLLPYQAFATGAGVDADGPYTLLILLTADEETASENAQRLSERIKDGVSWLREQPFSDFIHGADVSSDGRLVVAKLRVDDRNAWLALFAFKDTLLLHE
ncbi:MAG: SGNH hydrolase domain-containing protein, partial [Dehalococcoidia bacterium]